MIHTSHELPPPSKRIMWYIYLSMYTRKISCISPLRFYYIIYCLYEVNLKSMINRPTICWAESYPLIYKIKVTKIVCAHMNCDRLPVGFINADVYIYMLELIRTVYVKSSRYYFGSTSETLDRIQRRAFNWCSVE